MRDRFIPMVIVAAESTGLDLRNIIAYPFTTYPLSLAHSDDSMLKTYKSTLLKMLESMQ